MRNKFWEITLPCSPLPCSYSIPPHVLLEEDFTNNDFREQLEQNSFSIVHLVTHCQLSSHADKTFILTSSDRLNVNHLSKFLAKNNNQEQSQLLVLTACQTAKEDTKATLALTAIAKCFGASCTVAIL